MGACLVGASTNKALLFACNPSPTSSPRERLGIPSPPFVRVPHLRRKLEEVPMEQSVLATQPFVDSTQDEETNGPKALKLLAELCIFAFGTV